MRILGINSAYHESSASIIVDGKIVAAVEKERFTRRKHAKEASVSNPNELPEHSIRFCRSYLHKDHSARVQMVSRDSNPDFHALITHFSDMTGVPLVLNTSFNDSEPIVCSPSDAIKTFQGTAIDALFIGDMFVVR